MWVRIRRFLRAATSTTPPRGQLLIGVTTGEVDTERLPGAVQAASALDYVCPSSVVVLYRFTPLGQFQHCGVRRARPRSRDGSGCTRADSLPLHGAGKGVFRQ